MLIHWLSSKQDRFVRSREDYGPGVGYDSLLTLKGSLNVKCYMRLTNVFSVHISLILYVLIQF